MSDRSNRTQLVNASKLGVSNPFPFVSKTTRLVDCNVAKISECVELNTGEQLSAQQVRNLGHYGNGPTGIVLARRVFEEMGMVENTDYVIWNKAPEQEFLDMIAEGWRCVVFVDYGVMIDGFAPVGSLTYRGIHAIGVQYRFRRVWDYDPLFDGRTRRVPGHGKVTYPFGRQPARLQTIRAAASAFAGEGKVEGYAVRIKGE